MSPLRARRAKSYVDGRPSDLQRLPRWAENGSAPIDLGPQGHTPKEKGMAPNPELTELLRVRRKVPRAPNARAANADGCDRPASYMPYLGYFITPVRSSNCS
jgi:hypothetical protein